MGFTNLLVLKGGIREWREKSFAIAKASPDATSPAGSFLYAQHCSTCHGAMGAGVPHHFPPLRNDGMMTTADPWAAIYVVLHGMKRRPIEGREYAGAMAPFANLLTDAEIADLLTYARQQFGKVKEPVKPADVRRVREESGAPKVREVGGHGHGH